MAKRKATVSSKKLPVIGEDVGEEPIGEEATSQPVDQPVSDDTALSHQSSVLSLEPDTSGVDEPTEPEVSNQEPVSSGAAAPSLQSLVLSPKTVRPIMTEQVTVRCVVNQAILDGRFMVQGEGRQVAYGIYRQAWQQNPGAFMVRYPGAAAFIQEVE